MLPNKKNDNNDEENKQTQINNDEDNKQAKIAYYEWTSEMQDKVESVIKSDSSKKTKFGIINM